MTDTVAMAGGEAAAILLSLLGEEEAALMVAQLDPDDVERLCGAMGSLAGVGEGDIETVLGDFIGRARARNAVADNGSRHVKAAIERSLGPSRARAMLKRQGPAEPDHPVFAQMRWLTAEDVSGLIASEHPQVSATILGQVDPAVAAKALSTLSDVEQADLLYRVATLEPVDADALDDLARVLESCASPTAPEATELGGTASVAAILNRGDRVIADRAMRALAKVDRAIASQVDAQRVVFTDVIGLDDKQLGVVVRSTDAAVLARAMKGVDAATCDRFLAAMSARAAQSLRDEMEELTSLSRADVEAAQAELVATTRRLSEAGTIRLGAEDAAYV